MARRTHLASSIESDVTEQLQRARGQIAAGRIENRVVIGERHVFQPRRRHILIERGPAAIVDIGNSIASRARARTIASSASRSSRPHQTQRHQHHRGVVRVGIINVVVFERPSARFGMRIVHRPIAANAHFFLYQPVGGFLQSRMICRQSGFRERDDVDRRIPNRRKTRLNSKIFRVVDKEAFEIFRRFLINRIVLRNSPARATRSNNSTSPEKQWRDHHCLRRCAPASNVPLPPARVCAWDENRSG